MGIKFFVSPDDVVSKSTSTHLMVREATKLVKCSSAQCAVMQRIRPRRKREDPSRLTTNKLISLIG